MTYHSVTVTRFGGPDVLRVTEHPLCAPAAGEARIRVLAASVCRPDITVRRGEALYSGTPLGKKPPFAPGYAIIGDIEAVGSGVTRFAPGDRVGALTVTGGYSEVVTWRTGRLIPVPAGLDPTEAVTLILNYLVAWQTLHRAAKVREGSSVLVVGASGGIGTALLQLGQLAHLRMIGLASANKLDRVADLGAKPIDYQLPGYLDRVRQAEPDGLDAVIDGMNRLETVRGGLSVLKHGGVLVGYGEPESFGTLARLLALMVRTRLLGRGKLFRLYGTSSYFLGNRRPFEEDWETLFGLLAARRIQPVIAARFPILEAAEANRLLESGAVFGNVVLVAPERG